MPKGSFNMKDYMDDGALDDDEDFEDDDDNLVQSIATCSLRSPTKTFEVRVNLATESVPHCIGKGGIRMKEIEERWSCAINFLRDESGATVATIRGPLRDSLERAKLDLQRIEAATGFSSGLPRVSVIVPNIPAAIAIGKGGENIRRAETMLVHVDVLRDQNAVRIEGDTEARVDRAVKYFQTLVELSHERLIELSAHVRRNFAKTAETMFGVVVRGAGDGVTVIRGKREKVAAAEAFLVAREREEPVGGERSRERSGRRRQ
jgi:transcription antitermination factor NusA-like protein